MGGGGGEIAMRKVILLVLKEKTLVGELLHLIVSIEITIAIQIEIKIIVEANGELIAMVDASTNTFSTQNHERTNTIDGFD